MKHTQHRYQVMDGEPHLGTILEQQWVYDRDDIIEALVTHFEEDSVDSIDDIVYLDRDMEHSFTLDELIDLTDLDYNHHGIFQGNQMVLLQAHQFAAHLFGFGGIGIPEHDQLTHNQHGVVP